MSLQDPPPGLTEEQAAAARRRLDAEQDREYEATETDADGVPVPDSAMAVDDLPPLERLGGQLDDTDDAELTTGETELTVDDESST
ncbi:MAG: hypothetical protein R2737_09480 [Candidatus Nanopelagicales bacterium]